jgi:hypothetical protein
MAEQGVLPKFAPVGRPISLAPKARANEALLPTRTNTANAVGVVSATKQASATSALAVRPLQADGSSRLQPTTKTVGTLPLAATSINAVPISTNFFRLRKNPFATHLTEKTESPAPVQTELSLDAVKVVRNDLSDADYEVVPVTPPITPQSKQARHPRPFKPQLTGLAWSRLTARFFNSDRVRV